MPLIAVKYRLSMFRISKLKQIISAAVMLAVLLVLVPLDWHGSVQRANAIFIPRLPELRGIAFGKIGGTVIRSELKVCLMGFPPFLVPYPFHYIEVRQVRPGWPGLMTPRGDFTAKLYTFFPITQSYRYGVDTRIGAWDLGIYIPGLSEVIRTTMCYNAALLPRADGVVWKVGSALPQRIDSQGGASLPQGVNTRTNPVFDPRDPQYAGFCDPQSPRGECLIPSSRP